MRAVHRAGGYSRDDLIDKPKEELYKLRIAALKRMVRPFASEHWAVVVLSGSKPKGEINFEQLGQASRKLMSGVAQLGQFEQLQTENDGELPKKELVRANTTILEGISRRRAGYPSLN